MIENLIEQKESLILDEGISVWEGKLSVISRKESMKDFLSKPLYLISDNNCYGIIEIKNEKIENNLFLYDVSFLKRFENPISVKYSINDNGTANIEFLSEAGETSQANVRGTPFSANPLAPIWVINKKKKKRYRLDEEDMPEKIDEETKEDPEIDDFEIEDMENTEKILRVEKRGDKWCVIHGHPMKPGSKTDKPEGSIIHCFPTKAQADRMHKAIIISQIKRGELNEINNFKLMEPYFSQKTGELK